MVWFFFMGDIDIIRTFLCACRDVTFLPSKDDLWLEAYKRWVGSELQFIYQFSLLKKLVKFLTNHLGCFVCQMINVINLSVVVRMARWLCGHRMDRWSWSRFWVRMNVLVILAPRNGFASVLGLIDTSPKLGFSLLNFMRTWCTGSASAFLTLGHYLKSCNWGAYLMFCCCFIWWFVQVAETVDMARHYACSMDIHSSHQTLLVCGVAKVSWKLLPIELCIW